MCKPILLPLSYKLNKMWPHLHLPEHNAILPLHISPQAVLPSELLQIVPVVTGVTPCCLTQKHCEALQESTSFYFIIL